MSARECRREGEILRLGGVDYRLETVEGSGRQLHRLSGVL